MKTRLAPGLLALSLFVLPAFATEPAETESEESTKSPPAFEERVTVTESRLYTRPEPLDEVPAHVTVIPRETIERSGVETLQDLLGRVSGAVLYDQVGNDVQKTFDLRGFTDGSGTRVFLDGAPVNAIRNNQLALELIPLQALDRIEVTRGPAAALSGGGSEAGTIHMFSRRGEEFGGTLAVQAGSFDASRYEAQIRGSQQNLDYSIAGSSYGTDGFRQNADGELDRWTGVVGYDLGGERRLALSLFSLESAFGNPGSLTLDELEQGTGTPYNALDFTDESLRQATLNFDGRIGPSLWLGANLFYRDFEGASLTTGRSAVVFGGFALDAADSVAGTTLQLTHVHDGATSTNRLSAGLELLDGENETTGFLTPPDDPGAIDPQSPFSENVSDRRTFSLFAQDSWRASNRWTLQGGLRWDRDEIDYAETLPDPANRDSKSYKELSFRAGATWRATDRVGIYASYGEAFLPPTAEQLFAFPGFGSNPDLEAEDSRAVELGLRGDWSNNLRLDAALFVEQTTNEILFDPDSPLGAFGANVNAGETRRRGVEADLRGSATRTFELWANLTWTDAELASGPNEGNRVPLAPEWRLAAGLVADLPGDLQLRADALYVGDQVLSNDEANSQAELPGYTVVDLRLYVPLGSHGVSLFGAVHNLFDETYATRGIYAFDFVSGSDAIFVTPAPGRYYTAGLRWEF